MAVGPAVTGRAVLRRLRRRDRRRAGARVALDRHARLGRSAAARSGRRSLVRRADRPAARAAAGGRRTRPVSRVLRLRRGPRADWFDRTRLVAARRGVVRRRARLRPGRPAARPGRADRSDATASCPSEGIVLGAVQVPPSGQPVVFLADHPTTGGYPVVGVVEPTTTCDLCAQLRPGDEVSFGWCEAGARSSAGGPSGAGAGSSARKVRTGPAGSRRSRTAP